MRPDPGSTRRFRVAAIFILAVLGAASLSGCGERDQTTMYKDGKFRGKPDSRPWDNPPPASGAPEWNKGDRATWENQMRSRSAGQNEHGRINY